MSNRYPMPNVLHPFLDKNGRVSQVWINYLKAIEEIAGRVTANQPTVPGGASLGDVITAINAMNAAAQAANQQET